MRETQHACSTVPSFSPCLLLFLLYGKFPYAFELLVSFPQKDFFMEIPWSLDFLNFKKLLESLGHSKMLSSLHPVQKREELPPCVWSSHCVPRFALPTLSWAFSACDGPRPLCCGSAPTQRAAPGSALGATCPVTVGAFYVASTDELQSPLFSPTVLFLSELL